MKRRDALATLVAIGTLASPLCELAQAQSRARPARIGLFLPEPNAQIGRRLLVAEMNNHGWVEGREFVVVDLPSQANALQVDAAAARAVVEQPDIFVVQGTSRALALHRRTATIPIVMWTSGYPVEVGLARSLGRPGKNVTGNTIYAGTGIWGKMVELLHETKPGAKRVGVLWGYSPPAFLREEIGPPQEEIRQATRAFDMRAEIVEYQNAGAVPAALARIEATRCEAMMLVGRGPLGTRHQSVLQMAEDLLLPTIADSRWPPFEERNPLLAFGASWDALMRQAVAYLVRILQGTPAGDLPIQQPAKFELVVNLRTAKALRMKVPQSILLRADEVIE